MAVIFLNSWRGFQGDCYAESRPGKKGGQVSVGTMRKRTLGWAPLFTECTYAYYFEPNR